MSNFTAQNIIFGYKFNKLPFTVPTPYLYNPYNDAPIDYQGISRTSGTITTTFTIPNHSISVGDKFNAFNADAYDNTTEEYIEGNEQPFEVTAINGDDVTADLIPDSRTGNTINIDSSNLTIRLFGRYFFANKSVKYDIVPSNASYKIESTVNQTLTINFGDGTIKNIVLSAGANDLSFREHEYTDGNSEHTIILTFETPSAIESIATFRVQMGDIIPDDIIKFTNLKTLEFGLNSGIKQFPNDLSSLTQLENLAVDSGELEKIDDSIGQLPLKSLNFRNSLDLSQTQAEESLNVLLQLVELETLLLSGTNLLEFPAGFVNRTEIKNLEIGQNNPYTTLPQNIPTSIESIRLRRKNPDLTSYNNFSRLVNLKTIVNASNCLFGIVSIPNNFSNLTKLKTYLDGGIDSVAILDTVINNWYDFIAVREFGDITGANSTFRDMTFNIEEADSQPPTGTYQASSNFVQGTANGNPQSPFEKVYVLVKNFGHTWIINGTTYEN